MSDMLKNLEFNVISEKLEKAKHKKGERIIKGYASVGNIIDRQGEIITLSALEGAKEDLLRNPTIFREHKHSELPVGKVIAVEVDSKGLLITVKFTNADFANDVWQLIEEGILHSFSIGGRVLESEEKRMEDGRIVNVITKIELFETSVVGIPANPAAKFELVSKSFTSAIREEIEKKEGKGNMAELNSDSEKEVVTPDESGRVSTKVELPAEVEKAEETLESDEIVEKSEVVQDQTEAVVEKVEEVVEEITEDNEDSKSEEVSKDNTDLETKTEEVVEEVKSEEITDAEETEDPTPNSEVVEVVEDVLEVASKSTDESILEMLGKILKHLEAKNEDEEIVNSEVVEETKEVISEVTDAEVVSEDTVTEAVAKTQDEEEVTEEVTETESDEAKEVVLEEKSVKEVTEEVVEKKVVLDVAEKVEVVEKALDADDLRKSEVIVTQAPYSEVNEEVVKKATTEELNKAKDVMWAKYIYGKK